MNKKEYLDLLAKELDSMSYKDVKDILDYDGQCRPYAAADLQQMESVLQRHLLINPRLKEKSSKND